MFNFVPNLNTINYQMSCEFCNEHLGQLLVGQCLLCCPEVTLCQSCQQSELEYIESKLSCQCLVRYQEQYQSYYDYIDDLKLITGNVHICINCQKSTNIIYSLESLNDPCEFCQLKYICQSCYDQCIPQLDIIFKQHSEKCGC